MFGDLYDLAFWAASFRFGPHWELSEVESDLLAKRTEIVLRRMGRRRANRVMKVLDKFLPGLSLAGAISLIVYRRVRETRNLRTVSHASTIPTPQANFAATTNGNHANDPTSKAGSADRTRHPNSLREIPLSRSDLDEFFGNDSR